MWRSKKFILITVAAMLLVGGTAGVVLAADNGDGDGRLPEAQHAALLNRTCEIYQNSTGVAIDPQELKAAFQQAQHEMMQTRLENRLQNMVEQGIITQEQAEQYREWWQSRPDDLISPTLFREGPRGMGEHPFMNGPRAPIE